MSGIDSKAKVQTTSGRSLLLIQVDIGQHLYPVLAMRDTDQGLYVRALVTHPDAKHCSYFSVAATVHSYSIRQPDDPARCRARIGCATLDEVTITNAPANPHAVFRRYSPSAAVKTYGAAHRPARCGFTKSSTTATTDGAPGWPARPLFHAQRPDLGGPLSGHR